jgi:choline dehydrogenase-like flavoprotein
VQNRIALPGVGRNLQDRYEIAVVHRMARDWRVMRGARFAIDDPLGQAWCQGQGMYTSNGAAIAAITRSSAATGDPDLFAMAMVARFEGYYPGYSRAITRQHDYLTWAILKGHTRNRGGTVTLRSADPRDRPLVNFNYFDPSWDPDGLDMAAMVEAVGRVRARTAPLIAAGHIAEEVTPGPSVASADEIAAYVRDNAWGHHACGSAAIGPREAGGVLDADFRVHGASGLRVVDASVFPRIPGFFIAAPIYMIAEKAAEVIARSARQPGNGGRPW